MSASVDLGYSLVHQSFEDIDEQAECLIGHDQSYQQLSSGQFHGQFTTLSLGPDLGIYFEKLNQLLDQSGSTPKDQYSVIFLMNEDRPCRFNGCDFSADGLFLGTPGSDFHGLGRPGTHFCVVSLSTDFLEPLLAANGTDGGTGFEKVQNGLMRTSPAFTRQLRQSVRDAVSFFEDGPLVRPRLLAGIRKSFADMVADYSCCEPEDLSMDMASRYKTVQRARDFIHANARDDISIGDICRHTGVSRRTLESSFQACLEQSPGVYLRLVRLNEIRRALRAPQNNNRSIGDIAAEWGVWHLSRFAQYYRCQFGELPSQTRQVLVT